MTPEQKRMGFEEWYRRTIVGQAFNPKTVARFAWVYQQQRIEELEATLSKTTSDFDSILNEKDKRIEELRERIDKVVMDWGNKKLQSRLDECEKALRDLWDDPPNWEYCDADHAWLARHPEHRATINRLTRQEEDK